MSITRKLLFATVAGLSAISLSAFAAPAGASPLCDDRSTAPICGSDPEQTGDPFGYVAKDWMGFSVNLGHVEGRAVDPDAGTQPIDVRIDVTTIDPWGTWSSYSVTTRANHIGPMAGYGYYHGFDLYVSPQWLAWACVTALNVGEGADTALGCVNLYFDS